MTIDIRHEATKALVDQYIERLALPVDHLQVTTDRRIFSAWLGRPIRGTLGGAFVFLPRSRMHTILINLERIDLQKPKALEIVVAEELIHMRDWLDGDHRRHSRHGYDRIAHRVADLVGVTLEEVRGALLPSGRRPYRYIYECPRCHHRVPRRLRGTWSCARCSPCFDRRFVLRLAAELELAN